MKKEQCATANEEITSNTLLYFLRLHLKEVFTWQYKDSCGEYDVCVIANKEVGKTIKVSLFGERIMLTMVSDTWHMPIINQFCKSSNLVGSIKKLLNKQISVKTITHDILVWEND